MMAPNRRYELSTEFRTPSESVTPFGNGRAANGATRSRPAAPTSARNAAWTPAAETTEPSPCKSQQLS